MQEVSLATTQAQEEQEKLRRRIEGTVDPDEKRRLMEEMEQQAARQKDELERSREQANSRLEERLAARRNRMRKRGEEF